MTLSVLVSTWSLLPVGTSQVTVTTGGSSRVRQGPCTKDTTEEISLSWKSSFARAKAFPCSDCRIQCRKRKANVTGSKLLLGGEKRLCLSKVPRQIEEMWTREQEIWWQVDSKVQSQASMDMQLPQERTTELKSHSDMNQCQIQGSNLLLVNPSPSCPGLTENKHPPPTTL